MQDYLKNTAVLIFVREQKEEAQLKQLGNHLSRKAKQQTIALLNRRVRKTAERTGLPTFIVSGRQQIGHSFGERLSNALASIFTEGFENVITIGNDCLQVSTALLRQTALDLAQKKVVLGPAEDGGVYLLGLQKSAFHAAQLAEFSWQQATLFTELKSYWQACFPAQISILPTAFDIDDEWSLQQAFQHFFADCSFKKQLASLVFFERTDVATANKFIFSFLFQRPTSLRAPPLILS